MNYQTVGDGNDQTFMIDFFLFIYLFYVVNNRLLGCYPIQIVEQNSRPDPTHKQTLILRYIRYLMNSIYDRNRSV